MKPRNIYNSVEPQQFTEREVLKAGGYVCKIIDAEVVDTQWGERLVLHFDITEGESVGYYQRKYDNDQSEDKKWKGNLKVSVPTDDGSEKDAQTAKRFKALMADIEDSNTGFHWSWDEKKLKGKVVGILFSDKEWSYNGNTGFFANPRYTTTVANIKEGKFKVPATQYLDGGSTSTIPTQSSGDGFMNTPQGLDMELPFN